MTYPRVIMRNGLTGHYADGEFSWRRVIAGDLRRLEANSRDATQIARTAATAGVSVTKALAVLDAFFTDGSTVPLDWLGSEPWGPRPPRVYH